MLISEPTGWLDPEDKQRQRFFEDKLRSQYSSAQQLAKKLPLQGEVSAVARQFPDGAIALSLLHSANQLDWQGPFNYFIHQPGWLQPKSQLLAAQQMIQYLTTRQCRWQFLLSYFGFSKEAPHPGCGHCDRCVP
jgi:ATP-dependent DNA helicase RecQ